MDGKIVRLMSLFLRDHFRTELFEDTSFIAWVMSSFFPCFWLISANSFRSQAGLMGYLTAGFIAVDRGAGAHQWDVRLLRFIEFVKVKRVKQLSHHAKS